MLKWLHKLFGPRVNKNKIENDAVKVVKKLLDQYCYSIQAGDKNKILEKVRARAAKSLNAMPDDVEGFEIEVAREAEPFELAQKEAAQRAQHEQKILQDGIPMSAEEFNRIILPILMLYPQFPVGFTNMHTALLYRYAEAKTYSEQRSIKDQLDWQYNDIIIDAARSLRLNYERLNAAASIGKTVKIHVRDKCCLSIFNGSRAQASDLLGAYTNIHGEFPIFPPIETPCMIDDGTWKICAVLLWPEYERTDATMPCNWRDALNAERIIRLERQLADARDALDGHGADIREASAAIGSPPDIRCLTDLGAKELRAMQHKHGLRGHRRKVDIAMQLMAYTGAEDDVCAIARSWQETNFDRVKNSARECFEHIEWLEQKIAETQQQEEA